MTSYIKSFKEWLPPHRLKSIYITLSISEFATGLSTPVFIFLFFSDQSTMLSTGLSVAERGIIYGLFMSLFRFAGMLANPVFASISDMLGRKKIVYVSTSGMFFLGLLAVIALIIGNIWIFVIGATLYSFFWAIRAVCSAAINDVTKDEQKINGQAFIQFFIGIGASLGPMIGGWLGDFKPFGYPFMLPFIILIAISLLIFVYAKISFPETLYYKNKQSLKEYFNPSNIKEIFSNKVFYLLMVIHILDQFSWGTYYNFAPVVTKTVFGYDVKAVGIFIGLIGLWLIVSTGIFIPILQRFVNTTQLIIISSVIGTFGVCITYAVSFFPHNIISHYIMWFTALPVAAGDVMLFCLLISLLSSFVSKKLQGTVVGLIYIVGMGMWCLAAPIGGYLMEWRANGALILCPISMILLLIFLFFSYKKQWFLSLNNSEKATVEEN